MSKSTLHRKVLTMASEDRGVAEADISGHTVEHVRRALADLQAEQKLHAVKVPGRPRRYFADEAKAKAYEERELRTVTPAEARSRSHAATWAPEERAVETDRTVYSYGPSPRERSLRSNTHSFGR